MRGFVTITVSDQDNIEIKCQDCVKELDCPILEGFKSRPDMPLPISDCDFFIEEASGLWGMDNE